MSQYNIPQDVENLLRKAGMKPVSIGGNVDYMEKRIGGWLCVWVSNINDAGSPEYIKSRCDIMLARLSDDGETSGEDVAYIRCKSVVEAANIIKHMGAL